MTLGVVCMSESVPVHLKSLDLKEVLIFDIRVDHQGGAEVVTLYVQPLLMQILHIPLLHGFLLSVDITQEIICGGRE